MQIVQTKIFRADARVYSQASGALEIKVNQFLKTISPIDLVDVRLSEDSFGYTALVIYKIPGING